MRTRKNWEGAFVVYIVFRNNKKATTVKATRDGLEGPSQSGKGWNRGYLKRVMAKAKGMRKPTLCIDLGQICLTDSSMLSSGVTIMKYWLSRYVVDR